MRSFALASSILKLWLLFGSLSVNFVSARVGKSDVVEDANIVSPAAGVPTPDLVFGNTPNPTISVKQPEPATLAPSVSKQPSSAPVTLAPSVSKQPSSAPVTLAPSVSKQPSSAPVAAPAPVTPIPSSDLIFGNTPNPTISVGKKPTSTPTGVPTPIPSEAPSPNSNSPSSSPSAQPSGKPSSQPSSKPSLQPSHVPSQAPSLAPSVSKQPSAIPSRQPSQAPSISKQPSSNPSNQPSQAPSVSKQPSSNPSNQPSQQPSSNSQPPSQRPSSNPSQPPSQQPSTNPSQRPSFDSESPSMQPSNRPGDVFKLDMNYLNVTLAQRVAIEAGIPRLESVVAEGLPSYTPPRDLSSFTDCGFNPSVIDDIIVCLQYSTARFLNSNNAIGIAGPIWFGGTADRPAAIGNVWLNPRLLTDPNIDSLVDEVTQHELLHVLGIGTQWKRFGLVSDAILPCSGYKADSKATAEYQTISGCTNSVPLQIAVNGCGGHWSPTCFGENELMAPSISENPNSLKAISPVTIGSLEDMLYKVDYTKADALTAANLGSTCVCLPLKEDESLFSSDYVPLSSEGLAEAIDVGTQTLLEQERRIIAALGEEQVAALAEEGLEVHSVLTVLYLENKRLHEVLVESSDVWTTLA